MKKLIISIVVIILLLLGAAGGIVAYVCSERGQQMLKNYAVEMLADKLKTKIALDSINVSFVHEGVELYGLRVDDRQGERMAQLDTLIVSFRLHELLNRKVVITDARCASPIVNTYKTRPDSAANYQFVIDTFKKDKGSDGKKDTTKLKFRLVVDKDDFCAKVSNVDMRYEGRYDGGIIQHVSIGKSEISVPDTSVEIEKLHASTRRYVDRSRQLLVEFGKSDVNYNTRNGNIEDLYVYRPGLSVKTKNLAVTGEDNKRNLQLSGIDLVTNNGKPHKHQGKKTRGWFDAGHLKVSADANVTLLFNPEKYKKGDAVSIAVNSIKGRDKGSGLRADTLSFKVVTDLKTATVSNLYLRDQGTTVKIHKATMVLPDRKAKRVFSFRANKTHGTTVLKNIARPFAPALCNFTTPLRFSTDFSGDATHLVFNNIKVSTKDGRLGITANGGITGLDKKKEGLKIHFNVSHMHARRGIKEQIVKHFVHRESLMGLLHSAGNIGYRGSVDIGYKYEEFKGKVTTSLGDIDASVYLDEKTKYMTCSANSDDFDAGTMFNNPSLKKLAIKANASFDIAGNKASKMLHRKRGKLPAGWMKGVVKEVKYKFVTCRNVTFDLTCDGDIAKGTIDMNKLFLDMAFDFTFTDTKFEHSLKIKPHMHVHNVIKGIKTLFERYKERRAEKREERAKKKAEKAAVKAEQKAAKAEATAVKKAAKAEAAAEKKAAKEAAKAEKAAAKAERKAEKTAAKEAKKAAKANQ